MESKQVEPSPSPPVAAPNNQNPTSAGSDTTSHGTPTLLSASGITSWARSLRMPQPSSEEDSTGNSGKSGFARFTGGFGLRLSPNLATQDEIAEGTSAAAQPGVLGSFTKGLVDSSKNAVKAVQVKARHMVSQNKRRYQEGGFDLDMTYITENVIAMGFPAGDMSSGFFGYVEGFYRNHMEEVIKFFETHHKGKYKVYNLCSERLYDASLFEGKVACFPFDDHNCPPIQLIISFCQSAYSWLKEDIENVVVVHCKAGMARTGLMISSLLLYLKFFPTAEESIDYYNQKRCIDGKGLVLPSQIRYVKYFERILVYFNGENQPARRCMLRGFRLHRCPYWVRPSITISNHDGVLFSTKKHPRTKELLVDLVMILTFFNFTSRGTLIYACWRVLGAKRDKMHLMFSDHHPEDFWFSAPKKGIMVFALPGEPGLTELAGDFKIHFHDRQGDFYCWLNTTMMENRKILNTSDLDGFDKRKLPSPGFQVEVVLVDYDGSQLPTPVAAKKASDGSSSEPAKGESTVSSSPSKSKEPGSQDKDDVFSDSEAEESGSSKSRHGPAGSNATGTGPISKGSETNASREESVNIAHGMEQVSIKGDGVAQVTKAKELRTEADNNKSSSTMEVPKLESTGMSEFKAIAADTSVFSFGDEDEYGSE